MPTMAFREDLFFYTFERCRGKTACALSRARIRTSEQNITCGPVWGCHLAAEDWALVSGTPRISSWHLIVFQGQLFIPDLLQIAALNVTYTLLRYWCYQQSIFKSFRRPFARFARFPMQISEPLRLRSGGTRQYQKCSQATMSSSAK